MADDDTITGDRPRQIVRNDPPSIMSVQRTWSNSELNAWLAASLKAERDQTNADFAKISKAIKSSRENLKTVTSMANTLADVHVKGHDGVQSILDEISAAFKNLDARLTTLEGEMTKRKGRWFR